MIYGVMLDMHFFRQVFFHNLLTLGKWAFDVVRMNGVRHRIKDQQVQNTHWPIDY